MKIRHWLATGVQLAWVVHPASHRVTVYRSTDDIRVLAEKGALSGDEIVPGFSCPVGDLFVELR